jgi:hypothetical protein
METKVDMLGLHHTPEPMARNSNSADHFLQLAIKKEGHSAKPTKESKLLLMVLLFNS